MEATQEAANPRYVTALLRQFTTGSTTEADLPDDWTVEEATLEISRALGLPTVDLENRPQHYELFVTRADGVKEKLKPTATIGEAVREGDEIAPMPEVTPGGRSLAARD